MGMTLAEKILSNHIGRQVKAGEIVVSRIDAAVSHDANRPLALEMFFKMNGKKLFDPQRVFQIIDHHYPAPSEANAAVHKKLREYTLQLGCSLYEGEGICHVVMPEKAHVLPGEVVIGTDSHTCTYGALGAFSTGVGSTDMGVALITGTLWFMVPETIKINVVGTLPSGVFAKDIILHIIASMTADGATYKAVEFTGPIIDALSMDGRFTLTNMVVEMGAKTGMIAPDRKTLQWVDQRNTTRSFEPVLPDPDAEYSEEITFDVSSLSPYVAKPHYVDNGVPIEEVIGTPITQGNLCSCTAARIEDLRIAANILKGRKIASGLRFIVVPGSREVLKRALDEGLISIFVDAGACFRTPSCSGCSGGGAFGVPADGDVVISTANRNFKGRLGNPNAFIYLASPATVAASMLEGRIADPRHYIRTGSF
ncbi:MAG: 3-isopropylmalate dehydratase large subunit [Deltaproteobacteria bacterium]|nr:3-isopropylmalate dehydratase large subunit [Deltaproteobacteria bacterium]MBW1962498.1 3-isopropylmalate dehydratase large subunit [Deltaproteobacteria bacterium]MBW2150521.1 3-isopropylmalate dehydratase large subunit [Deltaproteobacteria bacterium]